MFKKPDPKTLARNFYAAFVAAQRDISVSEAEAAVDEEGHVDEFWHEIVDYTLECIDDRMPF